MQDEDLENYKGMTAEEILQAQTPAEKSADVIDKEVTSSMEADTASGEDEAVPEPTGEEESQESSDENSDNSMSVIEHLTELRSRLIRSIIAVIACSCITYFFDEQIMGFLMAPAGKLYFMQPGEAFFSYAKVVLFSGFLLATPVVFYQLWRFFVPAFTRRERMILGILVPSSVLLFYAGLAFSFFFIVPFGIKFFMGMGSEDLTPLFSVEKYLDFIITFLLPFGLAFELPIIIIIMAQLGLVTSIRMKKYFRYVFFVSFIIGALLTPPDIISQITLALPLTALYALSYFVVRFILRK
ncbi:twin-arginine translocase subunit TatC [uncultured Anaerovibrio sp.]|uniref:twin-arginine translocase subunit TatC n=1 Tax=uncultured Anaerovibrio sp. TaxID=361586 RepID=UPI00262CC51C|nr:twin-arginine translocase subunit TatC [uncultured Anaerovibrio sp.]